MSSFAWRLALRVMLDEPPMDCKPIHGELESKQTIPSLMQVLALPVCFPGCWVVESKKKKNTTRTQNTVHRIYLLLQGSLWETRWSRWADQCSEESGRKRLRCGYLPCFTWASLLSQFTNHPSRHCSNSNVNNKTTRLLRKQLLVVRVCTCCSPSIAHYIWAQSFISVEERTVILSSG